MEKTILILDKLDYKAKELEIKELVEKNIDLTIIYTEYEDNLIRKVCKWKYIGEILLHLLYWLKSFNYARHIYFKNSGCKIVCINPIVGVFLGMFNRRKKFEIIIGGFLFEPKNNKLYYNLRKKIVSYFIKGIDIVVVYSNKEVKYYQNIFKVDKFKFVKYGIDYDAHEIYDGKVPRQYIFSGGRSNRDFHTLIKAYERFRYNCPEIQMCIATRPVVLQNESTDNILLLKDVVLETFGSAMEKAQFVVLPLIDTDISAGHQVLLEALERNMVVLVSEIDAVRDYVSEDQVIFYTPGDEEDLYNKLVYVNDNLEFMKTKYSGNRLFYQQNYCFIDFILRMLSA